MRSQQFAIVGQAQLPAVALAKVGSCRTRATDAVALQ